MRLRASQGSDAVPRWRRGAAVVALAASGLAGCSEDDSASDATGVNDADVAYVSSVVAHHAQSVQLLNLSLRQLDAGGFWVDTARMRRLRELHAGERMLRSWHEKVPETGLDHADEGKHLVFDTGIPGVLAATKVRAIEREKGAGFVRAWLGALLKHELGAVQLAETEIADGQNGKTVAIAEKDRAAHAAQVDRLRRMLAR